MLSFVDAATGSVSRVLSAAADSFEFGPLGEGSAATPPGGRSLEADRPPPPATPLPGWIDQDPALSEAFFYLLLAAGLVLVSVVFRRELGSQHPYRQRTRQQR